MEGAVINLDELPPDQNAERELHLKMAYLATLSEDERAEYRFLQVLGLMVRLRVLGATLRTLSEFSGWPRSSLGRFFPVINDLVSQVGQGGRENPKRIKEALSQMGQGTWADLRRMNGWNRQEAQPAVSDDSADETADILSAGLSSLSRLLNHHPADIVLSMTPERRAEVERLAPLVAEWLGQLTKGEG
jgi:hypothetical protein